MKKLGCLLYLACMLVGCSVSAQTIPEPVQPQNPSSQPTQPNEISEPTETTPTSTNRLEKILQSGKLVVATSPDYAPHEFIDPSKTGQDQYVGSDMELARYIADQLGVELEIQAMDFGMVLSSVDLGQADLAIAGMGYEPEREENFEMTIGYNQTGESSCQGLMVAQEDYDNYTSLEDFADKKIIAQSGSLQEGYVKSQLPNADLELVSSLDLAVMTLMGGKVDAFACSCDQMKAYEKSNPSIVMSQVEFDTSVEDTYAGNVICIQKGQTELLEAVNAILTEVNAQGYYQEWTNEAKSLADALGLNSDEATGGKTITQVFIENSSLFFQGLMGTLQLAFITVFFGTVLGAVIAMIRLLTVKPTQSKFTQIIRTILKWIASAYVEIIRGTPILVQLYIFSIFLPMAIEQLSNISNYWFVVAALVINSSAYVSEIIRAGIQAVDHGQTEAAKSLGLSDANTMIRIVLPQAIKNILPALGNEFVMMIKETSLASVFFINELMSTQKILQSSKFLVWQPLFIVAMIYFVVTYGLSQIIKFMEKRLSVSD